MATAERHERQAALLSRLAYEAEVLAAHHSEFIPDGMPVEFPTHAALRAAVSYGCAIGLRRAAELIEAGGDLDECNGSGDAEAGR